MPAALMRGGVSMRSRRVVHHQVAHRPFPELYPALQQKAVGGQESPVTTIRSSRFGEVQKHLAITRHVYNPQAVLVSRKLWDQMSAAERKILTDAMAEATTFQRQLSRAQSDEALANLKKAGMQVTGRPGGHRRPPVRQSAVVGPSVRQSVSPLGVADLACLQHESLWRCSLPLPNRIRLKSPA